MDHVPYPKNAAVPKPEIPYICGDYDDYDHQGFLDYPVRRGWADAIETFRWMDCPSDQVEKRTQNWLFFGFLHEILDQGYRKELFLRQDPNSEGYLVDTTTLPECLSQLTHSIQNPQHKRLASLSFEPRKYLEHLDKIFGEVNNQSERVDKIFWKSRWLTLSIKTLLQSIQQAISNCDYRVPSAMYSNKIGLARFSLLNTSMDTWCDGQARNLITRYSVIMYTYLAALPRHVVNLDHRQCPSKKCIANNVDFATYKTRHVEDRCQCPFSGPDISRVSELIREGSIPLVSLALNPDGSPHFDIVKAEPGIEYTAISHVWVGGLGNFSSNELPQCQLRSLNGLVKEVNKPQAGKLFPGLRSFKKAMPTLAQFLFLSRQVFRPPFRRPRKSLSHQQGGFFAMSKMFTDRQTQRATFWMDTLLIPVGEANAELRNKAIQSMSLVYARAKNVLVLDAELQKLSLQDLPLEQASAHVLSSSWMTRCWTLQEACLSGNWVVQFKDGIFDPYAAKESAYVVRQKAIKESAWDDKVDLIQESISWFDRMPGMRQLSVFSRSQDSELANFIETWNQLSERSTSKAEDLHVIFANMLDLPAADITKLPYDQRMKAILRSQSFLPMSLLYHERTKIDDTRNRWIPKNVEGGPFDALRGELKVTPEGLIFGTNLYDGTYVGLLVPSSVPRFEKFRIVDALDSEPLWARLYRDGANTDFEVEGSMETCYLMGSLDSSTRAEKDRNGHPGARFAVMGREGHLLRLRYEYSFRYYLSRPGRHVREDLYVQDEDEYPIITARRTAKNQVFRVDCG